MARGYSGTGQGKLRLAVGAVASGELQQRKALNGSE